MGAIFDCKWANKRLQLQMEECSRNIHPEASMANDGGRAKINIDISGKRKKDRLTCSCQQFRAVCLTMANTPAEWARASYPSENWCAQVLDVCLERSRSSAHTHTYTHIPKTGMHKGDGRGKGAEHSWSDSRWPVIPLFSKVLSYISI